MRQSAETGSLHRFATYEMILGYMAQSPVIIYCDGACSGNPGPGGWGSIVICADQVVELGDHSQATTNNRMEMTAVLAALQFSINHYKNAASIQVMTDSVYVIRGITQWMFGWKKRNWKNAENEEVSNRDLWMDLDAVVSEIKKNKIEIKWNFVKGHSGVPGNERCDQIAVAYSKNEFIELYSGLAADYLFDVTELPEIRPLPEMKSKSSAPSAPSWYLSYVNGVLTKHKTWKECEAVVKGRPAKFKKVSSVQEETEVKKNWGIG